MPSSAFSTGEYKNRIMSLIRLDSLVFANQKACLPPEVTQVTKLLIKISVFPFIVSIISVCILILRISKLKLQTRRYLRSSAYRLFLLVVLFSHQQLSILAFNLINCVWLGSGEYLKIDTTIECYQIWQWIVYIYILFLNIPFSLMLFLGPGILSLGLISEKTFLLGLLFPGPILIYISVILYKNKNHIAHSFCNTLTTDAILGEIWYGYQPFFSYRYLCWGGIIYLRRLVLVIISTFIASPDIKVTCMILVLTIAIIVHVKFHPYSDRTANACANLSLSAMLIVAIINFSWATLLYAGSGFDYGVAQHIGQGMATLEMGLVEMVPVGIILFCCTQFLLVIFSGK